MTSLYDMHCHLDFADNAKQVAKDAQVAGINALCSTVVPSSYVAAVQTFAPWPNIRVALGLHPWWVANGRVGEADVARFEQLAAGADFIGEIGLDFHGKRRHTRDRQIEVLHRLLGALRGNGGENSEAFKPKPKPIFLHSVRATSHLLDALEHFGTLDQHICVFHWFQGNEDNFQRVRASGCWFSVGARMLATDAGRAFAKAVPAERLLMETDNPPHEGMSWSARQWVDELRSTAAALAELRKVSVGELLELLTANSEKVLGRKGAPHAAHRKPAAATPAPHNKELQVVV